MPLNHSAGEKSSMANKTHRLFKNRCIVYFVLWGRFTKLQLRH